MGNSYNEFYDNNEEELDEFDINLDNEKDNGILNDIFKISYTTQLNNLILDLVAMHTSAQKIDEGFKSGKKLLKAALVEHEAKVKDLKRTIKISK